MATTNLDQTQSYCHNLNDHLNHHHLYLQTNHEHPLMMMQPQSYPNKSSPLLITENHQFQGQQQQQQQQQTSSPLQAPLLQYQQAIKQEADYDDDQMYRERKKLASIQHSNSIMIDRFLNDNNNRQQLLEINNNHNQQHSQQLVHPHLNQPRPSSAANQMLTTHIWSPAAPMMHSQQAPSIPNSSPKSSSAESSASNNLSCLGQTDKVHDPKSIDHHHHHLQAEQQMVHFANHSQLQQHFEEGDIAPLVMNCIQFN